MDQLHRLQVITEIIGEFRTAILLDNEPEQMGRMVLEVIQEVGDPPLADSVLNAYMKLANRESAVSYLDEAIKRLHDQIDVLLTSGRPQTDSIKH
ncbi:hypothetical protein PU629_17865 [Pullulanibacillus sp. KACC 23026]|uniref:hypothetical protein n=1 Tax=Pullulanibacillus sp. KACC 23026 TaxID=3028315 RepID=UPI0023AF3136|nr:hypothetical protein [Pullulanibacillus sp. KACC 23026]WEG11973.1 hypothetical protein PU629_17865 [Pullulanibacillus sp. KACC 23026]